LIEESETIDLKSATHGYEALKSFSLNTVLDSFMAKCL